MRKHTLCVESWFCGGLESSKGGRGTSCKYILILLPAIWFLWLGLVLSKLAEEDWIELLCRHHLIADEEVVLVRRLRKPFVLTIPKLHMKRCFCQLTGFKLGRGKQVTIIGSPTGKNTIELPEWVIRQLELVPGDHVCISKRRDKHSYILRKFVLSKGKTEVPGRVIIDHFADSTVTRTHYSRIDIDTMDIAHIGKLAGKMGKLRNNPFEPFDDVGGWMGFLFRKEIRGQPSGEDESFVERYRSEILSSQQDEGCWCDSTVGTAFNLIRLVEMGEGTENPAVRKAAKWLLSTSEPSGFPGLFMANVDMTEEFNEWKDDPAGSGEADAPGYMSDVSALYRKVNQRGSRTKRYQSVRDIYRSNRDVVPGVCELALTSSSAVVLQALIKLGFWDERRVRTAINTLLSLWSGRWCGCSYLSHGKKIKANYGPVDFNNIRVPSTNRSIYRLDWFTDTKEIMQIVGSRRTSPQYSWLGLGGNNAVIEKHSVGMGDCTLGIHEALSYHPEYKGSHLETIAALEFSRRQSSLGSWGDTPVSLILNSLHRLSHPMAAFLVLRTIPFLIREQQTDGLWPDEKGEEDQVSTSILASFRILRTLKHFDFLETLLPIPYSIYHTPPNDT